MARRDILRQIIADLKVSIGLLTRLPLVRDIDMDRAAHAAWAWPIAGFLPASLAAIALSLALWVGLSAGVASAICLTTLIMATGALHEDGLADSADGFWGGWDPERRLEIMKDSRIGTYGVIALIMSLLARWSLIAILAATGSFWAPLLASAALSRAPMVGLMAAMRPAREGGLSKAVGQPEMGRFWQSLALAIFVALLLCGGSAIIAALAALAAAGLMGWTANRKIGGQTGDVLGGAQQLAEIACLAVFVAYLT